MSGLRILAVGNMYPPHHLGGYELVWRAAMRHLREHGHTARVLTTDFRIATHEPDDEDTFRELRWYWHEHTWPRIGWRGRVALERHNNAVLQRHLRALDPDAVAWWSMGGMSLSLIERVRRLDLPAVAFVHDEWLLYAPRVDRWTRPFRRVPRLAAVAERLVEVPARVDLDRAARYMFVSETLRAHARAAGYVLRESGVAHSGIEPRFLDARPDRPWQWRILYVGRLDERKGVLDAVAALAQLPPEATLTLAGDGQPAAVSALRSLAHGLGVGDRVRELGMCAREALPDIYAAADVVVFPVRWEEPWGLVPLEAMGIGRPVVASGHGGSGEYLRDGFNCLLAPAEAPALLAGAIRRLAASPELRAQLRRGGLATAPRYSQDAFNEAVDAAVQRVARRSVS